MKTRELTHCDIRVFSDRVRKLKAKELHRHIVRVAAKLGEKDADAMIESVVDAIFSDEDVPSTAGEEMDRVLAVLEKRIPLIEENMDTMLRLVGLLMAFFHQGVRQITREKRLAERQKEHHH